MPGFQKSTGRTGSSQSSTRLVRTFPFPFSVLSSNPAAVAAQKRRVKSEPRIESSRIGGPPATPPPGGIVNSLMGMWRGASSSSIEFKSPQQQ